MCRLFLPKILMVTKNPKESISHPYFCEMLAYSDILPLYFEMRYGTALVRTVVTRNAFTQTMQCALQCLPKYLVQKIHSFFENPVFESTLDTLRINPHLYISATLAL